MSKFGIGERAPWGDFPPVIRNGDLHASKKEPEYHAAKAGNMPAAINVRRAWRLSRRCKSSAGLVEEEPLA